MEYFLKRKSREIYARYEPVFFAVVYGNFTLISWHGVRTHPVFNERVLCRRALYGRFRLALSGSFVVED